LLYISVSFLCFLFCFGDFGVARTFYKTTVDVFRVWWWCQKTQNKNLFLHTIKKLYYIYLTADKVTCFFG